MTQTTPTRDEAVRTPAALAAFLRISSQRRDIPESVRQQIIEAADLLSAPAPAGGGVDAVALPDDLFSHQASWRAALVLARDSAPPAREDFDDRAYWQHELDVFDRVYASLSPAATPVSEAGGDWVLLRRADTQKALTALDGFMGDTDPSQDTTALKACQALSSALERR